MNSERQKTLVRIASLNSNQRWAFQIFRYVQDRTLGGRDDDLSIDVIQGIPSKFLESDACLGIVTMAAEVAQVTHLGFIHKDGKLVAINTPEERWNAVQRGLWHQIWNPTNATTWILRPFFEAHLAQRPDIKLHAPENKFPEDIYFEKWHPEYITKQTFKDEWQELEALGIVRASWYVGGAEKAHYELNPTFFEAFRGGVDGSWKDDHEVIAHALYYLGVRPH